MKEVGFVELARAIRENTSLLSIDLSKNSLSQNVMHELFSSLADNYVICEVVVDMKIKNIPQNFSNHNLLTMYHTYLTRELIYL